MLDLSKITFREEEDSSFPPGAITITAGIKLTSIGSIDPSWLKHPDYEKLKERAKEQLIQRIKDLAYGELHLPLNRLQAILNYLNLSPETIEALQQIEKIQELLKCKQI